MGSSNDIVKRLSGMQKAAALLIALGTDSCANIFKMMENEEIERLAGEIARMNRLPPEVAEAIVEEFHQKIITSSVSSQGGLAYATAALSKALGAGNAMNAIDRIRENTNTRAFDSFTLLSGTNDALIETLRDEHPQTIALVLSHVKEQRAAQILASLHPELQADIIIRIANMKTVSPEVISQVENSLKEKTHVGERIHTGGVKTAAGILNRADIDIEKHIIESIAKQNSELAEKISDLMFTYDDIILINDMGIQKLLQEVDESDLLMSLKASTEEIKSKIFMNMSERRRQTIQDDLTTMPPVRLRDVRAAQGRMLATAKEMIQSGLVEVARDSVEEVFV